jgi:putative methionine-R-sulfoxide reductase with GAF domain
MAKFEVFIPASGPGSFDLTLRVEADNWLAALNTGMKKIGEKGGAGANVLVDIQDDESIHVTDPKSGRVFRIKEAAPPAAAAPAPVDGSLTSTQPGGPAPSRFESSPFDPRPPSRTQVDLPELPKAAAPAPASAPAFAHDRPLDGKTLPDAQLSTALPPSPFTPRSASQPAMNAAPPQSSAVATDPVRPAFQPDNAKTQTQPQPAPKPQPVPQPQPVAAGVKTQPMPQPLPPPQVLPQPKAQASAASAVSAGQVTQPNPVSMPGERPPTADMPAAPKVPSRSQKRRPSSIADQVLEVPKDETRPVTGKIGRERSSVTSGIDETLAELFERTQELESYPDPEEALYFLLDLAMDKLGAESGSVFLGDLSSNELSLGVARGPKSKELLKLNPRIPMGLGIVGFCAQEAVSLAISDVERDPRFFRAISQRLGYATRSILCAPMMAGGRCFGCIEVINRKSTSRFDESELAILSYLSEQGAKYLESVGG